MTLTTILQVFLVACCGGVLLEIVHWYAVRKDGRFPEYAKSPQYWAASAVMALAGGGLAVLYFGSRAEGIVALHVGLSAPLILQKLVTTVADVPGAKGVRHGLLDFFRW
jgi:hypothetical protein